MSRARSSGHCAPRSEYVNRVYNDNGFHRGSSFCGEPMHFNIERGESEPAALLKAELLSDCPKCAAKWGKAKLAELGGRIWANYSEGTPSHAIFTAALELAKESADV